MKKLLLFLVSICLMSFAKAQWTQTNCPYGGIINCIAISGSNIFAGTDSGMYVSSNNGSSWAKVNNGLPGLPYPDVYALAISGSNIFAGTINGVYLSSNNGNSWTVPSTDLTGYGVQALAINGNKIYAGTIYGVYMSSNDGSSWTAAGLTSLEITNLAISGSNVFAVINSGDVYFSSNNGSSWTMVYTGGINALAINGNDIFTGSANGGVFLSSNNGSSWAMAGLTTTSVIALIINGSNIFAGSGNGFGSGVYFSSDNGSSWSVAGTGAINYDVFALAINGSYIFAGTDGGGVWELPLSALGIKEINNNVNNITVYPNPVTDNLQIQTTLQIKSIDVLDITGRLLFTTTSKTINCSSFASGVYFIKATTEKGVVVKRFMKE